jgi:phosphoribosylformylglycinamidine cyclo-ligase
MSVDDRYPDSDDSVADVLLRPHRSYAPVLMPLITSGRISALAHITGGGLPENLVRVLPENVEAVIDSASWRIPSEFEAVQRLGRVERDEMFLTFNMGVGMVIAVPAADADAVLGELKAAAENAWVIGELKLGEREVSIR